MVRSSAGEAGDDAVGAGGDRRRRDRERRRPAWRGHNCRPGDGGWRQRQAERCQVFFRCAVWGLICIECSTAEWRNLLGQSRAGQVSMGHVSSVPVAGAGAAFLAAAPASDSTTILHSERSSPGDLEVGGELAGLPAGSTRYVRYEDLLRLPQETYTSVTIPIFTARRRSAEWRFRRWLRSWASRRI